ncbi:MAG: amino acid/amide transporter substrate-binding protein family [Marmoricola sp.]|nr:amino acid/amide transporter substrate-binding protein family [Marmoricola sp.]
MIAVAALSAALATGMSASLAQASSTPAVAKAPSCAGFHATKGVTAKTIRIGNSSDLTGPIPGIYTAAQQATAAYVAYFNSSKRICGRKLVLDKYDSQTETSADKTSYAAICKADFAAVGSVSAFDDGGAATAQRCGLPDLRAVSSTAARMACPTCFSADAVAANEFPNSVADYFLAHEHAATQKAGYLYLNAPAASEGALRDIRGEKARGMKFLYTSSFDIAEFNYGPYVQQLKAKGVEWLQVRGSVQSAVGIAQSMQAADFHPKVFLVDSSAYDASFLSAGGSAVEGAIAYINFLPLNTNQSELNLYKKWLTKVSPGAQPTVAGLYAWSAAKLFTTEAVALGGKLTRTSLVAEIKGVHQWTGGGLHAAMDVGGKHTSPCVRFLAVKNGAWAPYGGTGYRCAGVTQGK